MEILRSNVAAIFQDRMTRRGLLKRSLALGLSVPALGILLAACGSSASKATSTSTGAGAASTTSTGGATGSATVGGAKGAAHAVKMLDQLKFDPVDMTVKVGDTVTWTNTGSVPHTTTCDPSKALDKSHIKQPDGGDTWDSGLLNSGQTYSHTFKVAGDYQYVCLPHEAANMIGKITVQA